VVGMLVEGRVGMVVLLAEDVSEEVVSLAEVKEVVELEALGVAMAAVEEEEEGFVGGVRCEEGRTTSEEEEAEEAIINEGGAGAGRGTTTSKRRPRRYASATVREAW
jgi:hypothetical protein